ncbi:energy transducer TonB [Marinilabilia rubra]|uniref:TonB C-terminal domain-containing protein n=1 Tax=Marinilabilia rubra TaxID=2162893 RepID=A0A2U2B4H1_9BACT|nr:energy transducer TonB [Marinilabilia rubra]PWD97958.1 hypothetical protein DDZ16_17955 [Marinilabilia rubra]
MKIISLTILILLWTNAEACDCPPPKRLEVAQQEEFDLSDNVIIGEVLDISGDQKTFTLRVEEIFKGNLKQGQIVEFENNYYCYPFIDELGDWLIYSKKYKGDYRVNDCGLSRSLKHPERNEYFWPPPPPPSGLDQKKVDLHKRLSIENREKALIETKKELYKLRKIKQDSCVQSSDTTLYLMPEITPSMRNYADSVYTFSVREYFLDNYKMPEVLLDNGYSGWMVFELIVEKDGSLGNIKLNKGIDPPLDSTVLETLKSMPNWYPGINNGKFIRTKLGIPISVRWLYGRVND